MDLCLQNVCNYGIGQANDLGEHKLERTGTSADAEFSGGGGGI